MKVVIMGCGRTGASVAARLCSEGHTVLVIDSQESAFRRLPASFDGKRIVGSGMDQRVLQNAGLQDADAFMALAQGDNRNIFASQIAMHVFGVKNVVARQNDPFRSEMFLRLGIRTFSPTVVSADLAYRALTEQAPAVEHASTLLPTQESR
ncbi:MAG: TrkA family potassium uptake protein [Dehalococcoidia bacterium]|nr:TrkA family potassium uptake protein [Dehalococcoidia bacterium]